MFTADAHCDTLYEIAVARSEVQTVTPESLRAGDVGLQVFAMYVGENDGAQHARGRAMLEAMRAYPIPLMDAALPDAPPDAPSAVLSIEGGEMLEGTLERLAEFDDDARIRMIALLWNHENDIGSPAVGGSNRGLKPFGFELLAEMGRRGILADVSHINERGFWDVCERAALPPVASHSNCRWLCDVPRNLNRDQARAVIELGGFIGINFYADFLARGRAATIDDVVAMIDELMEMGGEKAVGFGSDFDGIERWPDGLGGPQDFPRLLDALRARGYAEHVVADIAGLNLFRMLKRAEAFRRAQAPPPGR